MLWRQEGRFSLKKKQTQNIWRLWFPSHLELPRCALREGTYESKRQCVEHWKSFVTQTVSLSTCTTQCPNVQHIQRKHTLAHSILVMMFGWVWGCGWSFGNHKRCMWAHDIAMVTMWEVRRRSWKDTIENQNWLAAICPLFPKQPHLKEIFAFTRDGNCHLPLALLLCLLIPQVWVMRRIRNQCGYRWRWPWSSSHAVTTPGHVFRV